MNSRASASFSAVVLLALIGLGAAASASSDTESSMFSSAVRGSVAPTQHPLVAQYTLSAPTVGQVSVEFGTDRSYGRWTASKTMSRAGSTVNILVAGMRPNTTYHMRARIEVKGRTYYDIDHTFTTGGLPPVTFPVVTVKQHGRPVARSGVDLVNSLMGTNVQAAVFDADGKVIWYYYDPTLNIFPIRQLANGNFLVSYVYGVREVDLAGNILRDVTLNQINAALAAAGYSLHVTNLHHDVLGLANGHWILLAAEIRSFQDLPGYPGTISVLGDAVVDLDTNNQAVWVWRAFDHLDVNRHPYGFPPDWTHSNALVYLPDGNLLLSMRNQSWVLKLDYANGAGSGDILWRLGFEGDFSLSAWGSAAAWFYNQHFPLVLENHGSKYRLALYDNGNSRPDTTGQPCFVSNTCYSRGVIMDLDESARTATVFWQYVLPCYSYWGGSVTALPGGYLEVDSATVNYGYSQVIEVPVGPARSVVWDMTAQNANFYRANRIPSLYPGVSW